jgi:hypothetical protein
MGSPRKRSSSCLSQAAVFSSVSVVLGSRGPASTLLQRKVLAKKNYVLSVAVTKAEASMVRSKTMNEGPNPFAYTCADEGSQPHTYTYMGMDLGGRQEHESALSTHTHTRTRTWRIMRRKGGTRRKGTRPDRAVPSKSRRAASMVSGLDEGKGGVGRGMYRHSQKDTNLACGIRNSACLCRTATED